MKIRHQLNVLLAVAVATLLVLGGTELALLRHHDRLRQHLTESAIPGFVNAAEMNAVLKSIQISTLTLLQARDADAIDLHSGQIEAATQTLSKSLSDERRYAETLALRGLLDEAEESRKNYHASLNEVIRLHQAGDTTLARATFEGMAVQYQRELEQILATIAVEMRRSQQAAVSEVSAAERLAQTTLVAVTMLSTLIMAVLTLRVSARINRRVNEAIDAARSVASGERCAAPINAEASGKPDEISAILTALETTRQSLFAHFNRILGQREVLATQAHELSTAKTRAESAERLKSEFLRNMTHELRTPLNGILGVLQLFQTVVEDPEQKELIDMAEGSARRLNTLIDDMLFFAGLRGGKTQTERQAFSILDLAERLRHAFARRAADKGLDFLVEADTRIPPIVSAHPDYIYRATRALLDNAIKFTPAGGVALHIDLVSTNGTDAMLEFRVDDTGPGVPEEAIEQLFAAFVQQDGSETRKHEGTGIGLATAKAIAEAIGGELAAHNRAESGASFSLRFTVGIEAEE